MSFMIRLSDAEVEVLATAVLKREMAAFAFQRAVVRSGSDYEGTPSLFVTAEVGADVPVLKGDVFARLHGALHETLLARGEERFPFFTVRRANDELAEDEGASGTS